MDKNFSGFRGGSPSLVLREIICFACKILKNFGGILGKLLFQNMYSAFNT